MLLRRITNLLSTASRRLAGTSEPEAREPRDPLPCVTNRERQWADLLSGLSLPLAVSALILTLFTSRTVRIRWLRLALPSATIGEPTGNTTTEAAYAPFEEGSDDGHTTLPEKLSGWSVDPEEVAGSAGAPTPRRQPGPGSAADVDALRLAESGDSREVHIRLALAL